MIKVFKTSVLLATLSPFFISGCAVDMNPRLLEEVSNQREIEDSLKIWDASKDFPEKRNMVLAVLLTCIRDKSAKDVNRANCLKAVNALTGKSDLALQEIDGLVLPNRIVKISQYFAEIENGKSITR